MWQWVHGTHESNWEKTVERLRKPEGGTRCERWDAHRQWTDSITSQRGTKPWQARPEQGEDIGTLKERDAKEESRSLMRLVRIDCEARDRGPRRVG